MREKMSLVVQCYDTPQLAESGAPDKQDVLLAGGMHHARVRFQFSQSVHSQAGLGRARPGQGASCQSTDWNTQSPFSTTTKTLQLDTTVTHGHFNGWPLFITTVHMSGGIRS